MAMLIEIAEFDSLGRAPGAFVLVPQLPPRKTRRIAAAGLSAAFQSGVRAMSIRNIGDVAIYFRVNQVDTNEATQAASGDDKSLYLGAGEGQSFILPSQTSSDNYKLDIRAA